MAPLDHEPLIPNATTEPDNRVNEAHRQATGDGKRRYVYEYQDRLFTSVVRPPWGACIAVDPAGWAIWLAPGADESELG